MKSLTLKRDSKRKEEAERKAALDAEEREKERQYLEERKRLAEERAQKNKRQNEETEEQETQAGSNAESSDSGSSSSSSPKLGDNKGQGKEKDGTPLPEHPKGPSAAVMNNNKIPEKDRQELARAWRKVRAREQDLAGLEAAAEAMEQAQETLDERALELDALEAKLKNAGRRGSHQQEQEQEQEQEQRLAGSKTPLNVVLVGAGPFAATTLDQLIAAGHTILGCITAHGELATDDDKRGRSNRDPLYLAATQNRASVKRLVHAKFLQHKGVAGKKISPLIAELAAADTVDLVVLAQPRALVPGSLLALGRMGFVCLHNGGFFSSQPRTATENCPSSRCYCTI